MGDIMLVQDTAGVLTSLDKFLRGERSVQKTSGCTKQALNSTATGPLALIILRIPISQDGTSGDHWENVGPAPVLVFAPPGRAAPVGYAKIGIQDDEPRHQRELLCSIESLLSSVLDKLA